MAVKFVSTSFGVGTLVRFKDLKSHRWEYAIYRGVAKHNGHKRGYEFSHTPLGPITRWRAYWPEFIEAATAAPTESEKP